MSPGLGPLVRRTFRFLDLTLPTVEENLALDEALLLDAQESRGTPVLRVWEAPTFAVVLGATSRMHEDVDVARCEADGVSIVRRSSGGGTVVVGPGAFNLTVVLPTDAAPGLTAVDTSQAYVLERLAEALRRVGCPAEVLGSGDLTIAQRKFGGSAQRRLRNWFFVHVSLLRDFPLERIGRYTRTPRRQPPYRAGRPHETFVTNLGLAPERLRESIRSAWLNLEGPVDAPPVPEERVRRLVAERFGDPAWVERF